MSLDDDLREELSRIAGEVDPDGEARYGHVVTTARTRRRVRTTLGAATTVVAVAVVAIFAILQIGEPPPISFVSPTTSATPGRLYRTQATVLQRGSDPAKLCFIVGLSHPPSCGDVPITNWDWSAVEGERSAAGTTWGHYAVVGMYDGTAFTVTAVTAPFSEPTVEPTFHIPCDEPAGGWRVVDASKASEDSRAAAIRAAASSKTYGGLWLADRDDTTVLVVTFTDAPEPHEAELRKLWGGPLCVARVAHAMIDLRLIQKELSSTEAATRFGFQALTIGVGETQNAVELGIVWARPGLQEDLDAKFGRGLVVVEARLRAVE